MRGYRGGCTCVMPLTHFTIVLESCAYFSRSVYSYLVLVLALGYLGEWEV